MAFNRDDALRNAEKALKANKLDAAIAEYARVVEHNPRDFNTANTLGDLHARAGQIDSAIAQYARIADQFFADGFFPKASALFKKILKIRPDDEQALLRLGQLAAKQGLLADARSFLTTVEGRRRARGDSTGADDVLIELAEADAENADARMQAARIFAARGDADRASSSLRNLAIEMLESERPQEAVDVLREAVHLVPGDRVTRRQLIGLLNDMDQAEEAEIYLTRDAAAGDPAMLLTLARAEFETGRLDEGREDLRAALDLGPPIDDVMAFMRHVAPRVPEAGYAVAESLADAALVVEDHAQAVSVMRAFLDCAPAYVPGALRLVELCLEGGLDEMVPGAQATLADAYAASGDLEAATRIRQDLADPFAEGTGQREEAPEPAPVADIPSLVEDVPEFDVYVYGQPVESVEPVEPVESEEQLIARLLAEEAAQDAPAAAPPAAEPEIDLTKSLDDLDSVEPAAAPAASLDTVFDDLRERNRAGEQQRAEAAFEEAELAAALRQVADAERLYAEASASGLFRFRASAALGRLLLGEGRVADAIEWLERATEVPAPDRDAGHALLYDLGEALERHGESMRALAIFMELNADAGDYRGVAARVERLARAEIGG